MWCQELWGVEGVYFTSAEKFNELFLLSIRALCFSRLSCSKYLLATTAGGLLCCWNLLTCSRKTASIDMVVQVSHWGVGRNEVQKKSMINTVLWPPRQWSGAPPWTPACCWLTHSPRTWLSSAARTEEPTVRTKRCRIQCNWCLLMCCCCSAGQD